VAVLRVLPTALLASLVMTACAVGSGSADSASTTSTVAEPTATSAVSEGEVNGAVDIGEGRTLYVRCAGTGSPTVILEGGDDDTSASYQYALEALGAETRTCAYDRGNLGRSSDAPGPRGLAELVSDLERLLEAAGIGGPYVLVGTSGGGFITAGYAYAHPDQVAGMVLVETPGAVLPPPPEVVKETAWDAPGNVEKRDYLAVERDAWAARREIGDIPVTVISNDFGPDASEEGLRRNVEFQQGWLVLSPRAKQVVVQTGHAVEEAEPQLVVDAILAVIREARAG
jgi:hypothetical protein